MVLHMSLNLFMLCLTTSFVNAHGNGTTVNLQDEVDELKNRMTESNLRLDQMSRDYSVITKFLKDRTVQRGVCQTMSDSQQYHPCGNCSCVEDFNLIQKYFCDCRGRPVERDCKEHHSKGQRVSGLYLINYNQEGNHHIAHVFCDQTTDGGGWTIFQRRLDGSENFFRNWTEYKIGFGQPHREHWLGNSEIFRLTRHAFFKGSELRIDMQVKGRSNRIWAKYSSFDVNGEHTGYVIHVSGFTGSTSDVSDQMSYHNNMKFSTYDVDNDRNRGSCSLRFYGAWWYNKCHTANLNGQYNELRRWNWQFSFSWYPHLLQFSEMKVRRK